MSGIIISENLMHRISTVIDMEIYSYSGVNAIVELNSSDHFIVRFIDCVNNICNPEIATLSIWGKTQIAYTISSKFSHNELNDDDQAKKAIHNILSAIFRQYFNSEEIAIYESNSS